LEESIVNTRDSSAGGHYYRPELDVLRFFAFLSVFLFHALPGVEVGNHAGWGRVAAAALTNFKSAGSFGVCLFFVLSSFLITELLIRERGKTGTVHVKAFYTRRILRIWPLYFFFLLVGFGLGHLVPEWRLETPRLLAFLALLGNWYVAAFGWTANPIAPLWSISIEEQFYLIWPGLAKFGGKPAIQAVSMLLLPVSWLAIYLLARYTQGASQTIWASSLVQFEFFALGGLAALMLHGRIPRLTIWARLAMITTGGVLWLAAESLFHLRESVALSGPLSYVAGYQMVAVGCLLLLLGFLGMAQTGVPRTLVYLGKISYGLYVFHYLCLDLAVRIFAPGVRPGSAIRYGKIEVGLRSLAAISFGLLMTVLFAAVSYRFLEKPFLRLKERFTFVSSRAA